MEQRATDLIIHRQETGSKGAYTTEIAGGTARMTCSRTGGGTITSDHTLVPNAAKGQGVGQKLVERGVLGACEKGRKIVPIRPYARAETEMHPEWRNVHAR